jgi:hypothetical protein
MRQFVRLTNCSAGNCPGFDQWADTQDFRVTGYKVPEEDKQGIPVTEDVVTVPKEKVFELVVVLLARLQQTAA